MMMAMASDRPSRLRGVVDAAADDIVAASQPVKVILFGSVARGDDRPDSDLDFLVILDQLDPAERARKMGQIRFAIGVRAPIDIFVTDVEEFDRRKDVNGSMLYWPAREGRVVYERSAA
jgi:predicted nucleotidyltransferase